MRKKNYIHNVIRIRKGKSGLSQVYWFIVILNKKKTSSHKVVEQLGFFRYGKKRLFTLNYKRLAYYLNKGYKLKKSIKKFIYWNTRLYSKKIKIKKKKILVKKKPKKLKVKNQKIKAKGWVKDLKIQNRDQISRYKINKQKY